jgi:uncharacterized protein with GYD domain
MAIFFMFGRYTHEGLMSIRPERTRQAEETVARCGGKVQGMYALLGERDICVIADFPSTEAAARASIALSRLTGISFSTSPAISADAFDRLAIEALSDG